MFDLIQGLEEVYAVKSDEDGNVFIFYTVTDDFMEENNLHFKTRVFEINLFGSEEPSFVSYAILEEPDEE